MSKVIKFKTSPVDSLPDDLMTYSEFAKRHGCSYHHIRNVVNFYGLEIADLFGVKKISEKIGCHYCKLYKQEKNKSQKLNNFDSFDKKYEQNMSKIFVKFYGVFMEIKGKVHCFFEQSGTFKNEFIKLGVPAEDYDIQNNFNETDHIIDLFAEIEKGYEGKASIFDNITQDDLIIAFFPCIYFTGSTNPCYFRLDNQNYKCLTLEEKLAAILDRAKKRENFYELLYKMIGACLKKNIRIILENPYSSLHFLHNNFFGPPSVIDKNRLLRGDYFHKPTGYWYFNCEPTYGESFQNDKEPKKIWDMKRGKGGLCSEERSMISPDYARNFICDFILGKIQDLPQQRLNLEF